MHKLSVIIPCFNEEEVIPHLAQELKPVLQELRKSYHTELIMVDDGSTDKTQALLQEHFGSEKETKIVQHSVNMNLGAALRTGISHASGDFVVTIDSDCSYHPRVIIDLLKVMDKKTDIVTATGLHPQGEHRGTRKYHMFLSRSAAGIYRLLLGSNFYSATSMNRLYRRKVLDNTKFESNSFSAVSEILAKSLLQGYKLKEIPYLNQKRKFGKSKMNLTKTIKDHLVLVSKIVVFKISKRWV